MAMPRVTVTDFAAWGNLVKTWALNVDRVQNGGTYLPPPTTVAEFDAQCAAANVGLNRPSNFTKLQITQLPNASDTIVLKLPPADQILDSETELGRGANYVVPPFYRIDIFNNAPEVIQNKMRVHAERIGDYTISICM